MHRGRRGGTRSHFLTLPLAPLVLVAVVAAGGEEPSLFDLPIDELVKIKIGVSSLREKTIFDTPSTVYVIDRQMLDLYNITSLREALQLVAGFSVKRTYLKNDLPTCRGILQDHYANKVLFMINGTPSWLPSTGEANINRLSIDDVERIEILRGPASVLYGTNAFSGAVNVVLKSSTSRPEFTLRVGDRGAFGAGGSWGFSNESADLFMSASASDERGESRFMVDELGTAGRFSDYGKGASFTLTSSYRSHSLLLNGFRYEYSALGVVPSYASGLGEETVEDGYLVSYAFSRSLSEQATIETGVTYDGNSRDFARAAGSAVRANVEGYRALGFVKSEVTLSDTFRLELGADYDYRRSEEYRNYRTIDNTTLADNNLRDKSITEYSFFSQVEVTRRPLSLLLGARYTDNELFGSNVSSRGTLVYSINHSNSAKLIYGSSFRAPALFELYFITPTYTVFGNRQLEPEQSTSVELAYLTRSGNLFAQALVYHARYDNKIFRIKQDLVLDDGTPVYNANVYTNGDRFSANGLEVELTYKSPTGVSFFANYSLVDGDRGDELDGNDHYNFKYVPEQIVSLGAAWKGEALKLSGVVNYSSGTGGPRQDIGSQATVDLDLGYTQHVSGVRITHAVSVKNLLDEEVVVPEYVRRKGLNEIPAGPGRRLLYSAKVAF